MPASRTPEGDPVRCPICASESRIDVSQPPGDSVCPVCGTHLWLNSKRTDQESTRQAIHRFIIDLQTRIALGDLSDDTCRFLVVGLQHSLAAHGAILWATQTSKMKMPLPRPVVNQHSGVDDTPEFAAEIVASASESFRRVVADDQSRLLLGVPLITGGRVTGVIEVIQRDQESAAIRQGYMRFLSFIAGIAAPLAK